MENEYIHVIHDIEYDPFYVYYYCAEQTHMYRGYCNSTQIPKLIIDATGSVVKKFRKFGEKKLIHFTYMKPWYMIAQKK